MVKNSKCPKLKIFQEFQSVEFSKWNKKYDFTVPPQTPSITTQPTEAVREGDLATFRCESTGGNPSPHFQWLFDNKTKVPEGWYIERPEANAGKSISTLQ